MPLINVGQGIFLGESKVKVLFVALFSLWLGYQIGSHVALLKYENTIVTLRLRIAEVVNQAREINRHLGLYDHKSHLIDLTKSKKEVERGIGGE